MELRKGHTAVVTGAASGIGLALATALADRGLSVVLADIEHGALAAAEASVQARGVATLAVRTDVSSPESVDALARAALERFGAVDVVCNNAGVNSPNVGSWEFDLRDWQWVLGVNLWGVIHGIRAFVPHLIERGHGHVLNTASMAGLTTVPFLAPYTASKRAVVGISESLREELDQRAPGVGVSVLCPSWVPTNLGSSARNRPAELRTATSSATAPLDRVAVSPLPADEVAELALTAIEENRLYVITHRSSDARLRAHVGSLLLAIDG